VLAQPSTAASYNAGIEKEKERTTLSSLATRLSPELESLEHRICCVVEGVDESQLLFRLSRVDPTDPTRELTFVLDLSTSSYKGVYASTRFFATTHELSSVLTISAPLPTLPRLLAQLEESGDIYTFVRDVRKAYADTTS
jgi:kinetochore protein Spc25